MVVPQEDQYLRRASVGLRRMLPPDFRRHAPIELPNALLLHSVEVARLYQCIDEET